MMLRSVEMRWFFPADLPASRDGFDYTSWSDEDKREDTYLQMSAEGTGVKFRRSAPGEPSRENKFEIKARQSMSDVELRHAAGKLEYWIKWSLDGSLVVEIAKAMEEGANLLLVRKSRWLRKISLDTGQPVAVKSSDRPTDGCGIEVTALSCGSWKGWSFGFEAFGSAGREEANFRAAVDFFMQDARLPVTLDGSSSYSYPAWLLSHCEKTAPRETRGR